MKINNVIVFLSSVITVIVTTALFQIFVPMINSGGACTRSSYTGGEICESIVGFKIPSWWYIGNETIVPVSIFFGILCGAVIAIYLILKTQKS